MKLTRVLKVLRIQKAAFCKESCVFTYKNVQCFWNGLVHEFYSLFKASQMSKVQASSQEYPHVEKIKNQESRISKASKQQAILNEATSVVNVQA